MLNLADYVPHTLVAALAGVAAWIHRDHIRQDDLRFEQIRLQLATLNAVQLETRDLIASNHADILKMFIRATASREAYASRTIDAIKGF